MNGLAVYIQSVAIGMAVVCAMVIASLCLLLAILYVFSNETERRLRLKKAMKRILVWAALLLVVGSALKYQADVRTRMGANAFKESVSSTDGGLYTARYAYLGGEEFLLRVYRTADMALLAERTYPEPDAVDLLWTKEKLIYDTSAFDGKGYIALPPTLLDGIRAKLP
jgi:hypothetical protein